MFRSILRTRAAYAGAAAAAACAASAATSMSSHRPASCLGDKFSRQRDMSFPLAEHHHGKARVRVLKVRRGDSHSVSEFTVNTRLYSPEYGKVYTEENNQGLVATDTQKNTVYIVAKRTSAETPEEFGVAIATHLMNEYPVLTAVEVEVKQTSWERAAVDGKPHDHAFLRGSPESAAASVRLRRGEKPEVVSHIIGMTFLKTTQSGFEHYLMDKYTLLPETQERCLASELDASWRYDATASTDYASVREAVREQLQKGIFGPAKGGVYSESLQATIYDAGCMVLKTVPSIVSIAIDTPNLHYLPFHALGRLGEKFENDVFQPTSEPSGTIHCTVAR